MLGTGDSKTSRLLEDRSESVWNPELDAAFMEALQIYPPMGKRRIQYFVSSGGAVPRFRNQASEGYQTKSFGRCQLIQAYIYAKTGKSRTRKQVSSHLQRFKNLKRDNPSALVPIRETTPPPATLGSSANVSLISGETFPSITRDGKAVVVDTFPPVEEINQDCSRSVDRQKLPESFQKQTNGLYRTTFLVPRFVQTMDKSPQVDRNSRARDEDRVMSDSVGLNTRAFGTSVSNTFNQIPSSKPQPMIQRHLASNIEAPESNPPLSSDASVDSMFSSYQAMPCYPSPYNNHDLTVSYAMPVTPVNQLLHTPQPPEIQRQFRTKTGSRGDRHSEGWFWPPLASSLDAIHTPFGPPNPLAPADNSPTLGHLSALAEAPQLSTQRPQSKGSSTTNHLYPRLPRRLSYSQSYAPTSSPLVFNNVSSAISTQSTSQPPENTIIDLFHNGSLASPLDIKCFALKTITDTHFTSSMAPHPFDGSS